ncbi:MAG: glycosyltransferase family 4 protein [Bacteroidia bacterium]|nr:glycosyltransferase family 4 protein [Bacteroidia bacterium]
MKIIYYSPHPTHDIVSEVGYATHQREVINALKSLGHQVFPVIMGGTELANLNPLAVDGYKQAPWKRLIKAFVPRFIWTSFNNFKLLKHDKMAGLRLENEIIAHQPDLIYERSEYLQDSGAQLAKKYSIKYIIEVNAPFVQEMREFEGYSLYQSKAHRVEKFKISTANKVIAVSSALGNFLMEKYNCPHEKLFIQPNCINPSKIVSLLHEENDIKQKLNLNNESKVIGFVGSMFPYHGVDVLIDAFAVVCQNNVNWRLLIIGDGVILNNLKNQVSKLGISDKVIFTGKVPHSIVFDYIAIMDMCIMAKSNWYGSPVKIFEYGLMNKPIIAPNTLPVLDVMTHEKDALIISDNSTDLANAIQRLISDEVLSKSIAENFHQKVLEVYIWENAAKNIIKLCE